MTRLTHEQVRLFIEQKLYEKKERDFEQDVESSFDFEELPKEVKSKIHWLAWEDGHSAGYYEVYNQYFDLLDLVSVMLKFYVKK